VGLEIAVSKNVIFEGIDEPAKMGKIDRPTPACKGDPGLAKFKAGMAKRKCHLCKRTFPYDLTYYRNGDTKGYICVSCHMDGKPPESIKADAQIKLSEVISTERWHRLPAEDGEGEGNKHLSL
jgi:hypothetical protein